MFKNIFHHICQYDWLLMGAVLFLVALGLLSLFSLSSVNSFPFFQRQLTWAGVGIFLLAVSSFIDFRLFRTQSFIVFLLYLFTVLLLLILLAVGLKVRGHESWFRYQSLSFQPVEVVKLSLVILLAKFFSKRHIEIYRVQHLIISGLYVGIPTLLVLLQPDLGSAIILIAIWVAMIIFSGIKVRHFAILILLIALVGAGVWGIALKPYQKSRIHSFLNPYNDARGTGYQMIQSMIAVGSGRIWGKGLGYGSQSHLNFLPESETDFIFATFAEEWGLLGSAIVLLLITVILWRIVRIGTHAANNFSRLYTLGFAAFIFVQSFIHIGMNVGSLPITGLTLPFMSYGGSSLITLLVGVGITQSIAINSRLARY